MRASETSSARKRGTRWKGRNDNVIRGLLFLCDSRRIIIRAWRDYLALGAKAQEFIAAPLIAFSVLGA